MTQTNGKTALPLPERVITLAAAGVGVELDSDSARALARDAIKLREKKRAEYEAQRFRTWDWPRAIAAVTMVLAATQLADWAVAVAAWLF